jgi:hypothetical protein
LAIVDPPYGINIDGGKTGKMNFNEIVNKDWDKVPPTEYFNELMRVSKNQIIWGANHFISKMPFDSSCWLVWDKGQRDFSLADGEMAWTSFNKAMRIKTYSRAKALQEGKIHPTQKPLTLYDWQIGQTGFRLPIACVRSSSLHKCLFGMNINWIIFNPIKQNCFNIIIQLSVVLFCKFSQLNKELAILLTWSECHCFVCHNV